jgi:L-ascorbate 6-phosphate lactonase
VENITDYKLSPDEAALWWLGQSGYVIKSPDLTITIDPYLSDAAAKDAPELSRLYPPPFKPEALDVSLYIVTHDHLDHLDPVTILRYQKKSSTKFIAPRQAAKKLVSLGVSKENVIILHAGESWRYESVEITGVFALATSIDVLDTTGYFIKFDNGRSLYHTSDTELHPLVIAAAPKNPEVMFVPINGKWGNPNADNAALFAKALQPRYVMPNHYDLMALNAENPEVFEWFCAQQQMKEQCIILKKMEPFVWRNK